MSLHAHAHWLSGCEYGWCALLLGLPGRALANFLLQLSGGTSDGGCDGAGVRAPPAPAGIRPGRRVRCHLSCHLLAWTFGLRRASVPQSGHCHQKRPRPPPLSAFEQLCPDGACEANRERMDESRRAGCPRQEVGCPYPGPSA